jgi:signal peptidase II
MLTILSCVTVALKTLMVRVKRGFMHNLRSEHEEDSNFLGLRFLWITGLGLLLDQATKWLVLKNMSLYQSIDVMPFFKLTYVRNHGAAFSFLSDQGGWQRWFFTLLAGSVSVAILYWMYKAKENEKRVVIALAFILGGAVGNLYDRIAYGYVVDFLDVYVGTYHWPAFNIADSSIFIGAAILIFEWMINNKHSQDTQ